MEKIKLEVAEKVANDVIDYLRPMCERIEIAGSIRRKKPTVHDIDIVALPNPEYCFKNLQEILEDKGAETVLSGNKLIKQNFRGVQVDIYGATENNFEVIFLIRTGSAEHNKLLCQKAIAKGLRLKFDLGLMSVAGQGQNIVANTEEGILSYLFGAFIPPEKREV